MVISTNRTSIIEGYYIRGGKIGFLNIFPKDIYRDDLICFKLLIFSLNLQKPLKLCDFVMMIYYLYFIKFYDCISY